MGVLRDVFVARPIYRSTYAPAADGAALKLGMSCAPSVRRPASGRSRSFPKNGRDLYERLSMPGICRFGFCMAHTCELA